MRPSLVVLPFAALFVHGCCFDCTIEDPDPDTDDTPPLDTGDTDHDISGDSGEPIGPLDGLIRGDVTVQVFTSDENGDLVLMDMAEAYPNGNPYGSVFVAAYTRDESGRMVYHGDTTLGAPVGPVNPYEIAIGAEDLDLVNLYAALDFYGEGVIDGSDPVGFYPATLTLTEGEIAEDIDINIMVWYYVGGGGSCDGVTINGDARITGTWIDGSVGVFATDMSGNGPRHTTVSWTTPVAGDDGASGPYSLFACMNDGPTNVVGAWDRNGNGLLEPTDPWGAYASEPDVNGNPVSVGTESLYGYDVQIPLGDGYTPFDIVPFVSVTGNVAMEDGAFSELPEGSTLYVAALKYRPDPDVVVAELVEGYDLQVFLWEDLVGATDVDYELHLPGNTIAYLWAYVDTDGDGVVNESGEPVGSGGGVSSGRITVAGEDVEHNIGLRAGATD